MGTGGRGVMVRAPSFSYHATVNHEAETMSGRRRWLPMDVVCNQGIARAVVLVPGDGVVDSQVL